MSILAWIEDQKRLKLLNAPKYVNPASDSSKGLWTRCDKCGVILYIKHLKENQRVCFGCSYHLQMSSQERVENLLDKDSWRPLDETVSPCDPLEFHDQKDYTDRLQEAQERTGLQDAIQTGSGMVNGIPIALGVMDFDFMGGSMGSVVGEKVTRLIEYATQEGLTLVLVCASGGARMQEGVFSLMQMAKISSALQVYQACANLLYISILTSPTTGGVTASFAMLGDIIFAEPKALVAFAGRRVIEQTLCEDLPEDFQTSEYMLHHGLLDLIVPRRFFRQALSESIRLYKNAPFKKPGRIPFGVQNPITFLVEERIRRRWAVGNAPVGDKLSRLWVESKRFRSQQSSLLRGAGGKDADGVSTPSPSGVTQNVFTPAQLEGKDSSSELTVLNRNGSTKTALSANAQEIVRPGAPSQSRENSKPFQDGIIKESEAQTGDINKQKDGVEASGSSEQAALLAMETPRAVPSQKQSVSTRFQPTTEVATSSLLDASVQNHDPISGSLDPLLQREAIDYRDILTSFQTMFNLFSKELVLPYASVYAKNTRLDEHKEGETVSGMKKRISLDSKAEQAPYETDFEDGNANLLHKFFTLSENKNLNQAERLHTRLRLSEDAGPQTQVENMSAGNISNGTNQSQSVKKEIQGVDQSSRPAALEITTTGIPTPTSGASSQAMEPLSVHRDVPPSSLGTSKELVGSPSVYVDFLNQSIELAATESVEWRAFYLHQKISQTTGFIEDLAQSLPDYPQNNNEIAFQNMIFYRSICRKLS